MERGPVLCTSTAASLSLLCDCNTALIETTFVDRRARSFPKEHRHARAQVASAAHRPPPTTNHRPPPPPLILICEKKRSSVIAGRGGLCGGERAHARPDWPRPPTPPTASRYPPNATLFAFAIIMLLVPSAPSVPSHLLIRFGHGPRTRSANTRPRT